MIARWQAVGFAHGVMQYRQHVPVRADVSDYGPYGL